METVLLVIAAFIIVTIKCLAEYMMQGILDDSENEAAEEKTLEGFWQSYGKIILAVFIFFWAVSYLVVTGIYDLFMQSEFKRICTTIFPYFIVFLVANYSTYLYHCELEIEMGVEQAQKRSLTAYLSPGYLLDHIMFSIFLLLIAFVVIQH